MIGFAAGPLAKTGLPMPYLGCPTLSSFFSHKLYIPPLTQHLGSHQWQVCVHCLPYNVCSELIRINIIYLFILFILYISIHRIAIRYCTCSYRYLYVLVGMVVSVPRLPQLDIYVVWPTWRTPPVRAPCFDPAPGSRAAARRPERRPLHNSATR